MQDGCATQDVAHPVAVTVTLASPQRPTATTRHRVTAACEPPASSRRAAGEPPARRLDSCQRAVFAWLQPTGSHDDGRQAVSTRRRLRCPRLPS